MFVCDLDRPWMDSPFLLQGFLLKTPGDVKTVREVCDYVYVDPVKGTNKDQPSNRIEYTTSIEFEDEIENASQSYGRAYSLLKSTMDNIRFGNAINVEATKEVVNECVDSIVRNPNAMLLLTQLKDKDQYTSQHILNVCILAVMLGRHLGLPVGKLEELGLCGLLHDMGKMKVPNEILNKEGRLDSSELAIMKRHTSLGMEVLMSARGIILSAVDVAHNHHERLDGKGYPRGLTSYGITEFTRKVAIVDTYDAITRDRVYRKGRSHLMAINILAKCRNTHFDAGLVKKFVECIGIYPLGSLVELNTGEVGIVTEVSPKTRMAPKLLMIMDKIKNFADNACWI